MAMSARTKTRWLILPFLAMPSYLLVDRHLAPGSFWAELLTYLIVVGMWLAYGIVALPAIDKLSKGLRAGTPPALPRAGTRTIEDRLDELERLKRRDMVTPEEYSAKRIEILKDL